jgi:hypothetical protein
VLEAPEPLASLKKRVRAACIAQLTPFKVPAKVVITEAALHGARQKKIRR